jgi:transposase
MLLLATLHEEPVGCGSLKLHPDGIAELKRIWVAASSRGLGLGRRLLGELEAYAAGHGAHTIRLDTNHTLVEAIALYRSGSRRLSPGDWAEIRRLHRAEGVPIKAIARQLGVSRNTVRRALAARVPPRYQRPVKGSIVSAIEPQIRELLAQWPRMPATVIAERVGWTRSLTVLKVRVRRPLFIPPDPASRTEYRPGELAQCDQWSPPVDVPLGFGQVGRPPVWW